MNSFERGFIKRALEHGLTEKQARGLFLSPEELALFKKFALGSASVTGGEFAAHGAGNLLGTEAGGGGTFARPTQMALDGQNQDVDLAEMLKNKMNSPATMDYKMPAGGGLLGGLLGAGIGSMSSKPENKKRNALIGGGVGAGLGTLAGMTPGMIQSRDQSAMLDMIKKHIAERSLGRLGDLQ